MNPVKRPFPDVLYKYLPSEHAATMVSAGAVKIGTLFSFRTCERFDLERGDSGEGRLSLHSDPGRRVYNSTAELPPVLRSQSIHCGPGGIVTQGENAIALHYDGPDMFVYCTSVKVLNEAEKLKWGGACVKIVNPRRFLQVVDTALRLEIARRSLILQGVQQGLCHYIDRQHNWHQELPPQWLLKPLRFQHQHEFRAAWAVDGGPQLEEAIIQSSEIAALCELM